MVERVEVEVEGINDASGLRHCDDSSWCGGKPAAIWRSVTKQPTGVIVRVVLARQVDAAAESSDRVEVDRVRDLLGAVLRNDVLQMRGNIGWPIVLT